MKRVSRLYTVLVCGGSLMAASACGPAAVSDVRKSPTTTASAATDGGVASENSEETGDSDSDAGDVTDGGDATVADAGTGGAVCPWAGMDPCPCG